MMYAYDPSLSLSSAYIALQRGRAELKGQNKTISGAEFEACGGKRKRDKDDYSLERQMTLALRSLRQLIKEERSFIDSATKVPAKKQMTKVCSNARDVLSDLNNDASKWDDSDDEEVNNMDGPYSDEDESEEEQEQEEDQEEEEDDGKEENDADDDPDDPDVEDPESEADPDAGDDDGSDAEDDEEEEEDEEEEDEEEEDDEDWPVV